MNYLHSKILEFPKDDLFVTVTLQRMPDILVRLFALKVAYQYPGGIDEAIQDLMKNAINE